MNTVAEMNTFGLPKPLTKAHQAIAAPKRCSGDHRLSKFGRGIYNMRKLLMNLGWGLLLLPGLLQTAHADVDHAGRYTLPPSKVNFETCQREALRLHPGFIDELRILPQPKTFWIRYQIHMRGGLEWSVVCDLSDGRIARDQALDSN
jgi:hypothetical protein